MSQALVIGGTGPTGPLVVEGLVDRGFRVSVLHGGQHEVEFSRPGVQHIHADPHFMEGLEKGIGGQTYDLVVAQYGRLRLVAEYLRGRTERLIAIGAATDIYAREDDPRWGQAGRPTILPDSTAVFVQSSGETKWEKISFKIVEAMDYLFDAHATGAYSGTYIGYPVVFGPRQPGPQDWSIVRRVLDGRESFVIADGGLKLESRLFARNAARAVLLTVDRPDEAGGRRYSVADESVFTMRSRIEMVARHMDHEFRLLDMPYQVAWPAHPLWRRDPGHRITQSNLIRQELGYEDEFDPDSALAETIDWLLAHRPTPGGETERQLGDPFDYSAEDQLIKRWDQFSHGISAWESPITGEQPHQYRHPTRLDETWDDGQTRGDT